MPPSTATLRDDAVQHYAPTPQDTQLLLSDLDRIRALPDPAKRDRLLPDALNAIRAHLDEIHALPDPVDRAHRMSEALNAIRDKMSIARDIRDRAVLILLADYDRAQEAYAIGLRDLLTQYDPKFAPSLNEITEAMASGAISAEVTGKYRDQRGHEPTPAEAAGLARTEYSKRVREAMADSTDRIRSGPRAAEFDAAEREINLAKVHAQRSPCLTPAKVYGPFRISRSRAVRIRNSRPESEVEPLDDPMGAGLRARDEIEQLEPFERLLTKWVRDVVVDTILAPPSKGGLGHTNAFAAGITGKTTAWVSQVRTGHVH